MQIEVTADEKAILTEVLESTIGDLRQEVSRTDNHDFKEALKRREATLRELAAKVQRAT